MGDSGRFAASSASGSHRSATPSHMSIPHMVALPRPIQRLRPRKGVPQRCLQGDNFLDYAPPPYKASGNPPPSKHDGMYLHHNVMGCNDPPYAPSQKRKAATQPGYPQGKASTRAQRRREETPFHSHDSSGDLEATANGDGEVAVRRSKRQRRTVAGFEGYNESLSAELSAEEALLFEEEQEQEEEEEEQQHTSHVFESREEALAALANDVMRIAGVQSFRICLELANDLARYKHPPLQDWPRYTPHVC